jgi:hypothetical protein
MDDPIHRFMTADPNAYDSPEQVRESAEKETTEVLRQRRLRQVEAAILETPQGREWLWGVLSSLHVHDVRIAVSGSPFEQGIWIGEQMAGQRLLRRFAGVNPHNFALMFAEFDNE